MVPPKKKTTLTLHEELLERGISKLNLFFWGGGVLVFPPLLELNPSTCIPSLAERSRWTTVFLAGQQMTDWLYISQSSLVPKNRNQ